MGADEVALALALILMIGAGVTVLYLVVKGDRRHE